MEKPHDSPKVWTSSYFEQTANPTLIESPTLTFTLEDAVANAKGKRVPFEDIILFGEVKDNVVSGEVAISPQIFCHHLKEGGKIRSRKKKGAIKKKTGEASDHEYGLEDEENRYSVKQQKLFYVSSTNSGITKVVNTSYEGKHLCVISYVGDKLKDAISRDGRFADELKLFTSDDKQSEIAMHYEALNYCGKVLLAKKPPPKRKLADEPIGDEASETRGGNQSAISLPDNLSDPTTEDIARAMMNEARNDALEAFAEPGSKGKADFHINKMVKKFGKKDSCSIPARISDTLSQARGSVGYLHCGDYGATCWLLCKNVVITSRHVFEDISKIRMEATDEEINKTIFVDFHFDSPGQRSKIEFEIDEKRKGIYGQGNRDYAILFLKDSPDLNNMLSLGLLVRLPLPSSGSVVLLGHPEKRPKQIEICQIIPGYKWYRTLCERRNDAIMAHDCESNPEECMLNPNNIYSDKIVECIHMYQGKELNPADHSDQIPYDTSFFHGASGSPVFNSYGHIIAMHTMGYPFSQSQKKHSLMEFGITLAAIYDDIIQQEGPTLAFTLFPEVQVSE
ncbi:protein FAM111A-like [Dendronephthya gigantea]|uniref:protein FAM111A-like n=1 Tax=Dendronephthya gigantea TaxID=151771 RepID=UPI00106D0B7E|nr:protein FAM111A-like [Dendronephthya gigantea]